MSKFKIDALHTLVVVTDFENGAKYRIARTNPKDVSSTLRPTVEQIQLWGEVKLRELGCFLASKGLTYDSESLQDMGKELLGTRGLLVSAYLLRKHFSTYESVDIFSGHRFDNPDLSNVKHMRRGLAVHRGLVTYFTREGRLPWLQKQLEAAQTHHKTLQHIVDDHALVISSLQEEITSLVDENHPALPETELLAAAENFFKHLGVQEKDRESFQEWFATVKRMPRDPVATPSAE